MFENMEVLSMYLQQAKDHLANRRVAEAETAYKAMLRIARSDAMANDSGESLSGAMASDGSGADVSELTSEALKEYQYLVQAIIDIVPMRVFWKDRDLCYLGCNEAFARDAGKTHPGELLGHDDFAMGWAEQAELYRADDRAVMASGIPRLSFEEMQTTPDGQTLWLRTSKAPLKNRANETIGVVGIYEDITEFKQALKDLDRTQEQLIRAGKLAALGSLVAGIAHELNTPVGNSLMAASTLLDRTHEFAQALNNGPLRRSLLEGYIDDSRTGGEIVLRNLERTAALVASFKQVAVDRSSSQRREFQLDQVVGEILLTLSSTLNKTAFEVKTDIAPEFLMDSFPGPLGAVIASLIDNALVHAFEGREQGTIEIVAHWLHERTCVALEIIDNGRGIPAAHLSRIFDPFFTTRLGQGGSRFGLHIVHNVVTGILGGSIHVTSRENQQTRFVIEVPVSPPDSEPSR